MPRTTRKTPAAPADLRPFSPDAPDSARYAAQDADGRKAIAASIAQAKSSGASGNEMRERFGSLLTGPARRKVLREHGFDGGAYIARSYDAYRDGEPRTGSRHAREHGAAAVARKREHAEEQAASMPLADARKLLREAGTSPMPRGEAKVRAAVLALLLSAV